MRGLFSRMRERVSAHGTAVAEPGAPPERQIATDSTTHAFWGAGTRTAREPSAGARERVAALVDAHERGITGSAARPRGNPAFSEALFVELMRARQYRRAFEQLSAECRRQWGSADAFAAAQGTAMRRLLGVAVKDVRYLSEWCDPHSGVTYREVAELDVEYMLAGPELQRTLQRVVHLVPDEGRWRSLCYPA